MSILLSKTCVYGIRAAVVLARYEGEGYLSIPEVSKQIDVPSHTVTKVMQALTEKHLVESQRGPAGGVRLAVRSDKITVLNVVLAIDGEDLFTKCVLELPSCNKNAPCALHHHWAVVRAHLTDMLTSLTLKALAEDFAKHQIFVREVVDHIET
jgi:Rrf2 family protein